MDVFVARQPIFDSEMNVFAYELLFRSSLENFYDTRNDSNLSTLSVITSSLLVFGLDTLTNGKPAFINFTKKLLLRGTQASLPKELFAIEVIEDIEPDMLVLRACRELKDKGYLIVLDDFVLHDYKRTLLDVADIIKVDFLNTTPEERAHIVQACKGRNIALLAEKVETPAHMQEAREMGYSYFQGYYLERPTVFAVARYCRQQAQFHAGAEAHQSERALTWMKSRKLSSMISHSPINSYVLPIQPMRANGSRLSQSATPWPFWARMKSASGQGSCRSPGPRTAAATHARTRRLCAPVSAKT